MIRTIEHIEADRLTLQAQLDAEKTALERNKLGQFATPTTLAREILAFGRKLLGTRKKIHFLDPAIGTGSFFSALKATAPESKIGRALGFDIDPHYAQPALKLWHGQGLDLRIEDFTTAEPPNSKQRVNLIISNPPYVRHHHLAPAQKRQLQELITSRVGIRPNGLSGLYCYFLLLCDAWLQPGGISGWLIPSEWMDVNYGAQVKEYLTDRVTLLRIHRFDPADVQFDDALVSSAIVWFKKAVPDDAQRHEKNVELSFGGSLLRPNRIDLVSRDTLHRTRKWTQLPKVQGSSIDDNGPTLADLFTIKRGIATGSNRFFVLPQADISDRKLPQSLFRPILPSPRYLSSGEIRSLANGDPDIDKRLYLLTTQEPESLIKTRYPHLWDYLQEGMASGIHERYLCRHRRPWYAQEHRPPAPILCTYMGRITDSSAKPFRFFLNRSQATAANVYLLLYPRPVLQRVAPDQGALLRALWTALNELPIEALLGEGRVYGGGLHKLEPKELAHLPLAKLGIEIPREAIPRKHENLELFPG